MNGWGATTTLTLIRRGSGTSGRPARLGREWRAAGKCSVPSRAPPTAQPSFTRRQNRIVFLCVQLHLHSGGSGLSLTYLGS